MKKSLKPIDWNNFDLKICCKEGKGHQACMEGDNWLPLEAIQAGKSLLFAFPLPASPYPSHFKIQYDTTPLKLGIETISCDKVHFLLFSSSFLVCYPPQRLTPCLPIANVWFILEVSIQLCYNYISN